MNLKDFPTSTLSQQEQIHLAPFYLAYNRPYPPAVTWRELRSEGFMPIEHETVGLEGILEGIDEQSIEFSYRLDSDGNVVTGSFDRPDWVARRIHQWQRPHLN